MTAIADEWGVIQPIYSYKGEMGKMTSLGISFGSNVNLMVETENGWRQFKESGGGSATEFHVGDKVILGDFKHETFENGSRVMSWHWIADFDVMIGKTFTVRKVTPKNVARLEEVKMTAGFPFHWLIKIYELPEELFEI